MANSACLLRQVERDWSRRFQRPGAGFKVVGEARTKQRRKSSTSFLIVDAQSVKNIDSAREKGYDAGKKVSGIKRHIAVDTRSLPHAIIVTTAGVTNRKDAFLVLGRCAANLQAVQSILADGGISASHLPKQLKNRLVLRFKSPNAVNGIPLPSSLSVACLSDPSPGSRNADAYRKTANANSISTYSFLVLLLRRS